MALLAHPLLCLFLLVLNAFLPMGAAVAAAFPIPDRLVWKHSKHNPMRIYFELNPTVLNGASSQSLQVPATLDRSELLAFLSELAEWASRMNEAPLPRPEKMTPVPREERTPVPQPPTREKVPCKNFFWKTFSSC
ncbi:cortistatin-like [Varanus komodoensis]|uniref:cortistatin-like n=1 Tax=Varanus komodoensis TaxID=61221 RepID=UPI001CF7C322|nr:cortistatin-like [Varanus komodoensis]